jgi:hypothetical protein
MVPKIGTEEVDPKREKKVAITIAEEDFEALKNGEYRLCFAKKVNDTYNVVWQSYKKYLELGQFAWEPVFEIFCTNKPREGLQVTATTKPKKIALGQTIILDENGRLGEPYTGGPANSITLENDYGSVYPALSQLSIGISGLKEITPIYAAEKPALIGEINLIPVDEVLIWFEQPNIKTSTLFGESSIRVVKTKKIEVDLTSRNAGKVLYKDQRWQELQ